MASGNRSSQPSPAQLAELSALADGTLPAERRAAVEASIAASPALRELLQRERLAVAALARAAERDRAPHALRERIERGPARARTPRRAGRRIRVPVAAALAAAVVALALALPGGTPGAPTLSQAAALAARGSVRPAPAPDPEHPGARLDRSVDDVYFPNWTESPLRWRAVGQRIDRLDGHRAVTVYYMRGAVRIAYTILTTPPLREPAAAVVRVRGLELRELFLAGRMVVTWRRHGHTCVLSGRGVDAERLVRLAASEPH